MKKSKVLFYSIALFCVILLFFKLHDSNDTKTRVIFISIDGLRSDAITALGSANAPNFHFLTEQGVSTLNARTDYEFTTTIPNHTSMLTARPVNGKNGHHAVDNYFGGKTIHDNNQKYIPSIFDALKKQGLTTALIASKPKFGLYAFSYTVKNRFLARKFHYNDHAKIDFYYNSEKNDRLTYNHFMKTFKEHKPHFTFLHFTACDTSGHKFNWDINPKSEYLAAVKYMDSLLGKIIQQIKYDQDLGYSIVLIITSDHGGSGNNHKDISNRLNFTIPFIVWGTGIARGKELPLRQNSNLFETVMVPIWLYLY